MHHERNLLTSHDAADLLGIKYATFHKRHIRGSLPFQPVTRLGSYFIWRRSDIETYKRTQ